MSTSWVVSLSIMVGIFIAVTGFAVGACVRRMGVNEIIWMRFVNQTENTGKTPEYFFSRTDTDASTFKTVAFNRSQAAVVKKVLQQLGFAVVDLTE